MNLHRTTQRDIAAFLGLHVTTVSMALRQHPSLPRATCERVKEAARQLNYTPDPALSALMEYRRHARPKNARLTIAYLTAWPERDAWRNFHPHEQFYLGAQTRATELGYHLEPLWLRERGVASRRWNSILKTRNYSGLIVAPLAIGRGHLRLDWEEFCAVSIDPSLVWPRLVCVGNNQIQMMRLAVRTAWQKGYRRIGLAGTKRNNERVDRYWSAAYLDEVVRQGDLARIPMYLSAEWNAGALVQWVRQYRPDVILCQDHRVQKWLEASGFNIPGDIGFINLDISDFSGKCAGIRQYHQEVGTIAMETLDGLICRNQRGIPKNPRTTLIDGSWIDGATIEPTHKLLPCRLSSSIRFNATPPKTHQLEKQTISS